VSVFTDGLPKAELHLHIEGTLEPELRFELASRNGIPLPWSSPQEARAANTFDSLTTFLVGYYEAMKVLRTEQDFYDLAMAYFRKARSQNVMYAEIFFDPQAHTSRGVPFSTVVEGLDRARADAAALGLRAQLIMCFLRDMSAESAAETLAASLPFKDRIIGVGLDSDERDNPPSKFRAVFAAARDAGYRLTMHCDVDQDDAVGHIWQAIDEIGVSRVDHGVNCVEDPALVQRLVADGIGLTVCPISNGFVTEGMKAVELKSLLDAGIRATVNSDDPAYMDGYVNENYTAVQSAAGFSDSEMVALARNSFEITWLEPGVRDEYLRQVDAYVGSAG
jgi:adenosine deaminase